MAKIIKEKRICAHCGQKSEQDVLLSCSCIGNIDLDTRPSYTGRNNIQYEIQECPHCHFCSPHIDDIDRNINEFSGEYLHLVQNTEISTLAKRFLLAAVLGEQSGDFYLAGMLYLKAAWVFDDINDIEYMKVARKKAAENLRIHIERTSDGDSAIMLVDILRRIEDFEKALIIIEKIGDAENELINSILDFQRKLIADKDTSCHTLGEMADE